MTLVLKCFTIYDQKARAYITPFFAANESVAIRTFENCCTDPNHAFGRNPQDYSLHLLCDWDATTGLFDDECLANCVVTGTEAQAAVMARMPPLPLETATQEDSE